MQLVTVIAKQQSHMYKNYNGKKSENVRVSHARTGTGSRWEQNLVAFWHDMAAYVTNCRLNRTLGRVEGKALEGWYRSEGVADAMHAWNCFPWPYHTVGPLDSACTPWIWVLFLSKTIVSLPESRVESRSTSVASRWRGQQVTRDVLMAYSFFLRNYCTAVWLHVSGRWNIVLLGLL
jgi:hypothetical protein